MPGDEQDAHRRPHGEARGVRADHHGAPRQPVADHAAERERRDLRDRPGGEAETDLGRAAAEVENSERDGDRREIRADVRDAAGGEEEPEVPLAERVHGRMVTR